MNFEGQGQPCTSTTFSTPGTFSASLASNETSLPPTTGGRAITANFMPGIFASMPYVACPVVMSCRSTIGIEPGADVTEIARVLQLEAVHRRCRQRARRLGKLAVAQHAARGRGARPCGSPRGPRPRRRPSVPRRPARASCASPRRTGASAGRNGARCATRRCPGCRISSRRPAPAPTRTRDQSPSISSATTIGRLVRTPVPISERLVMMVTRPDGSMATNTCGSLTVPPGILPAPVSQPDIAGRGSMLGADHQRAGRRRFPSSRTGG